MSAWVVSKAHIDVLVGAALQIGRRNGYGDFSYYHDGERHEVTLLNADEVGRMLIDECVKSVSYRYPGDDVGKGELPGPIDPYYNRPYTFEPVRELTAGEIAKAAGCFSYQSCEHPGWEASQAYTLVDTLVHGAARMAPDYEEAPWGFEDEDVRPAPYVFRTHAGL